MPTTRRAALTLAALLGATPLTADAETVWTAVASEKIRPETAARGDQSVLLAAAKNEFEAFQVVVTGPATGVSATASELAGPGKLPAPGHDPWPQGQPRRTDRNCASYFLVSSSGFGR